MDFFNLLLDRILGKNRVWRPGSGFISAAMFILGVSCLFASLFLFDEKSVWHRFSSSIANLMIVGGFLGALIKSSLFLGVFRQELKNVIYDPGALRCRNDMHDIFQSVCRGIHSEFNGAIVVAAGQYYHQYFNEAKEIGYIFTKWDRRIKIEWDDRDRKIIRVKETLEGRISVVVDCADYRYYYVTSYKKSDVNQDDSLEHMDFIVDRNPECPRGMSTEKFFDESGVQQCKYIYKSPVKKGEHDIVRTSAIRMPVSGGTWLRFMPTTFIADFRVRISYPDDLNASFIPSGVSGNFHDNLCNRKSRDSEKIDMTYMGLLCPRQGYILVLSGM